MGAAQAPICTAPKTEADVYGDDETFIDDPEIHARVVKASWEKIPSERGPPGDNPMMNMIPYTFAEMYNFNQPVMQKYDETKKELNMDWTQEIIPVFGNLVKNIDNASLLKSECDALAPKISAKGVSMEGVEFFKHVMIASLRSLLPDNWDIKHEVAWKWFWEKVSKSFTLKADLTISIVQQSWGTLLKEQPPCPEGEDPMAQSPCTYAGMAQFNQMVLQNSGKVKTDMAWAGEFAPVFATLVETYHDSAKFEVNCGSAAGGLKGKATVDSLAEYKMIMLCSLRALMPQKWSSQHEAAWGSFWKKVSTAMAAKL